ncbi:hypothetical protein ACU4GD_13500 [Cupriavidus basilensis]
MPDVPDVPVSTATTTSNWKISAGPGIYVAPKLPGARDSLIYLIIYQDIDYKGRFFSRGFDFPWGSRRQQRHLAGWRERISSPTRPGARARTTAG